MIYVITLNHSPKRFPNIQNMHWINAERMKDPFGHIVDFIISHRFRQDIFLRNKRTSY
jgi:hypothetical protein